MVSKIQMVEMYKDTGPLSSTNTLQEKREGGKERGRGEKGGGGETYKLKES